MVKTSVGSFSNFLGGIFPWHGGHLGLNFHAKYLSNC